MRFIQAIRARTSLTLIGLIAAAGIAGQACADPVGSGRVVTVRNADTVIIEDHGRVIYISSPKGQSPSKAGAKKRVGYAGIGTDEAIRQHNEVVGQLMDSPPRPIECH